MIAYLHEVPNKKLADLLLIANCRACENVFAVAMDELFGTLTEAGVERVKAVIDKYVSWDAVHSFGLSEVLDEYIRAMLSNFDKIGDKPTFTFLVAVVAELMFVLTNLSKLGVGPKGSRLLLGAAIDMISRRLNDNPKIRLSWPGEEDQSK
jgi:hypothetical protein